MRPCFRYPRPPRFRDAEQLTIEELRTRKDVSVSESKESSASGDDDCAFGGNIARAYQPTSTIRRDQIRVPLFVANNRRSIVPW